MLIQAYRKDGGKSLYYSQIKKWAKRALDQQGQVVIYLKDRAILVLPNKEIDLGILKPKDRIRVRQLDGPTGPDWSAYVIPAKESQVPT